MSQFARTRFRDKLAWENSERQLVATYRQLLDVTLATTIVDQAPQEPVATDSA